MEKWKQDRAKIIGLGEKSFHKSYYPELQNRLDKLQASNRNTQNILSCMSDSVMIVSNEGKLLYVNEHARKLFNLGDLPLELIDMRDISNWEIPGGSIEQKMASLPDQDFNALEWEARKLHTGEVFTVQVTMNSIIWNEEFAWIAVLRDFTERKEYEQELIQAKEKAEESDRLKSAFLANISHEIRTPLNGILGFSSLLRMPDLSTEDMEQYIQIIESSGQQLLSIISDILDISKIEAGVMHMNYELKDVNSHFNYLKELFMPEAEAKGLQLFFDGKILQDPMVFHTDHYKVVDILSNLLRNAINHTEKGSIEFGYHLMKKGSERYLEFYVRDTGSGISEKDQKIIFDRFVKAEKPDANELKGGTGLGLTISKAYAEKLGGRIWLKSTPGKGSTFYFIIKER